MRVRGGGRGRRRCGGDDDIAGGEDGRGREGWVGGGER